MLDAARLVILLCVVGISVGSAPTRLTIAIYDGTEEMYVLDFSNANPAIYRPLPGFAEGNTYQFKAVTNGETDTWNWNVDWGVHKASGPAMTYTFKVRGAYHIKCTAASGNYQLEASLNVQVLTPDQVDPPVRSKLSIANDDPAQVNRNVDLHVTLLSSVTWTELSAHGSSVEVRMEYTEGEADAPEFVDRIDLECSEYNDQMPTTSASGPQDYKVLCSTKYTTAFPKQSLYSINASLEHKALEARVIHTVCVKTDLSCRPPRLRIQVPDPPLLRPTYEDAPLLRFRHDESIHLFSNVIRDSCLDASQGNDLDFEWHVIRMAEIQRLTAPLSSETLQDIIKVDVVLRGGLEVSKVTDFYLSSHALDLGSYLVVFSATEVPYCGPSPVFVHDYVRLDVLPRLIVATIYGGSYREWRPETASGALELDGSGSFIHDEQSSDDVRLVWICRLASQRNVASDVAAWDHVLKLQTDSTGGCFGRGFVLGPDDVVNNADSAVIAVPEERFAKGDNHYLFSFLVYRMSTGVVSVFEQEVAVRRSGVNVQVSLVCASNCGRNVAKDANLRLEATCVTCNASYLQTGPQWSMLRPGKAAWERIPHAITQGNVSILTLSPVALTEAGEYNVEVSVVRKNKKRGLNALATARYRFNVPASPSTGFCEISPYSGIALSTKFSVRCDNFVDPNPPLIFTVAAVPASRGAGTSEEVLLYQGMSSSLDDILLPPGHPNFGHRVKVRVTTTNKIGRRSTVSYHVTVTPPEPSDLVSNIDSLVQGNRSQLAHMLKGGNVDGALGLMSSALKTVAGENVNDTNKLNIANGMLEQLTRKPPQTAKNAYQYASALALITNSTAGGGNEQTPLDDKRRMAESMKSVISSTLQSDYMKVDTQDVNEYVVPALGQALGAVASLVALPTGGLDVDLQSGLLGARETVLQELAGRAKSGEVFSSEREIVQLASLVNDDNPGMVNPTSAFAAGVLMKDSALSTNVALSSMFYNPFPDVSNLTNSNEVQLPVVGLSFLSNGPQTVEPKTGRSRASQYDVLLPLRSPGLEGSRLTAASIATVVLPPSCGATNGTSAAINDATQCGAATVNLSVPAMSAGEAGSAEDVVYLAVRPKYPCRLPAVPCVGITFVRASSCDGTTCNAKSSRKFVLPRGEGATETEEVAEDPWSLPVDREMVETYGHAGDYGDWVQFSMLVENLQDDSSVRLDEDERKFQQVQINIVRTVCKVWDNERSSWSPSSCSRGRLVKNDRLLCRCFASATNPSQNSFPLLFTGGLIILPNRINFHDMVDFLARMRSNPYVIVAVVLWWFLFFPAFYWAHRKDRSDEKLRHFHIPEDSDPEDEFLYEVVVFTGHLRRAGTTANVTLSLEGDSGAMSDMHVISDVGKRLLQRGGVDTFLITSRVSLGKVTAVRLWHDNTGTSPRWFLNRVAVYDLCSGTSPSLFLADSWLSLEIAPFLCRVELHESTVAELTTFKTALNTSLLTQAQITNVWLAPFHRTVCSPFTRVQRMGCCMVAIFSCMLASIMFFDAEGSNSYKLLLGYVAVDLSPVVAAAEAALLLAPVNLFASYIFRNVLPRQVSYEGGKADGVEDNDPDAPLAIPRRYTITDNANIVENDSTSWWIMQCLFPSPNKIPLSSAGPERRIAESPSLGARRSAVKRNIDWDLASTGDGVLFQSIIAELKEIREIANGISKRSFPRPTAGNANKKFSVYDGNSGEGSFDRLSASQISSPSSLSSYNDFSALTKHSVQGRNTFALSRCHLLAWVAVLLHLLACSSFTVLYGFQYGNDVFLRWLLAFTLSVAQNMFLVTPMRILGVAAFAAVTSRGLVNLRDWEGFVDEGIRQDAVKRWRNIVLSHRKSRADQRSNASGDTALPTPFQSDKRELEMAKRPWCYEQPAFERLVQSGKLKAVVAHVRRYWLETVTWVAVIALSSAVIVLQRDQTVVRLDQHVREYFLSDFGDVAKGPDALEFVANSLSPRLYGVADGPRLSYEFYLLGPIRLRQARLLPVACQKKYAVPYKSRCKLSDEEAAYPWQYDTKAYKPYWRSGAEAQNSTGAHSTPWEFADLQGEHETLILAGNSLRRPYYPPGGYTVDLGYSDEEVGQTLRSLGNARWVDSGTAALFVQFSIHTPNLQYVTGVTLAVELLAQGGVNLYREVNTYRPPYLYSAADVTLAVLQFFHFFLCVALVADLLWQCHAMRWKALAVWRTLTDFWNMVCLLVVALTCSSYVVYIYGVHASAAVSNSYKADPGRFAPFLTPAHYAKVHLLLLGCATFLSNIRLLKVFRGSKSVSVMLCTMSLAWKELLSVTLVAAAFWAAFGHPGHMTFGSRRHDFRSTRISVATLYSMSAGMDVPHPRRATSTDVLWVLHFVAFMVLVIAVLLNLYTAVVDDTYRIMRRMRDSYDWHPVENLAVAWLYEHLLSLLGVASSLFKNAYLKDQKSNEGDSLSLPSFNSVASNTTANRDRRISPPTILINSK